MKKNENFVGAVREQVVANAIEPNGRYGIDSHETGLRVKVYTNTRVSGPVLYSMFKALSVKFPDYVVKIERYSNSNWAGIAQKGIAVSFTKKVEA